ncbi:crossover junction endodeoxyribonuclease RuvC [Bacillus horti]|uniref:Crossover junction endodeoxyribonuclease RuvC n=1 Tax=Caldalkalibacillus horti TaxID=77523 RepID=A0ABT9VTP1_9BACI|nr:crossover junction endodeoxyribonuclease RuvC [Bacillus horti]MDQ0164255.1 crossover junction endodeoxyribonuclease RuvC [Bacillus horti]
MIILGIDPGIAIVGFGVIEKKGSQLKPVQYGSIETKAGLRTEERLKQVYEAMQHILEKYSPNVMAIEKLFFNKNVTTAFTVGQARGVMLLAAEQANVPVAEYTPLQVKQAVVGYGKAEKRQVQEMVRMLLNLQQAPKPDDVADALAIAICHGHSAQIEGLLKLKGKDV